MGQDTPNIIDHFRIITDPRTDRYKRHSSWDNMVATICSVTCGGETGEDIEIYGKHDGRKGDQVSRSVSPSAVASAKQVSRIIEASP